MPTNPSRRSPAASSRPEEPDAKYPSMWRVHMGQHKSGMVNLTRAKDAAIVWARPKGLGGTEIAHWHRRQTRAMPSPMRFPASRLPTPPPAAPRGKAWALPSAPTATPPSEEWGQS
jgi:hypothetical protein